MNIDSVFIPEIVETSSTVKPELTSPVLEDTSTYRSSTQYIVETTIETIIETTVETTIETTSVDSKLKSLIPFDEGQKDILIICLLSAIGLLVLVLIGTIIKLRKRSQAENGFNMMKNGSSVSVMNTTKFD